MTISALDATVWAEKNFRSTRLFNRKKVNRLVLVASRLAEGKGKSLAQLFNRWYDTKAMYKLLSENVMTPDIIQDSHRKSTYSNIENWDGDVLAIEDASEFDWNGLEPIEDLGPVGSGRKNDQGFILHSTLAIGVSNKGLGFNILGLAFQQYYVRPPKRDKRIKRSFSNDIMETDLWRTVIKKKALPALTKVIRVCDRNADIYEVIDETKEYGCKHIIRLSHDRLVLETDGEYIKSLMQNTESMGQTIIEKRFKGDGQKHAITLNLNWKKVKLRAPSRPGSGIGKLPAMEETVVHVWGNHPTTGEIIEWFLYTDLEVNDLFDAIKVARYYAARWTIEDYHKTLKSGLKAEDLQLETAHGLFAAIAIMSIVAIRVLDLREKGRINPDGPPEESGLDELELKVLSKYLKRELKSVKCVVLAIGSLGGHLNRRSDGMPGVLTLWLGMSRFLTIMEGVRIIEN